MNRSVRLNRIEKKIKKLIFDLEFEQAEVLIKDLSEGELKDVILAISVNTESIVIYTFVSSILQRNESSNLHYISSVLMSAPLCHIEGAYEVGLFHAKKAIELSPNDLSLYKYILFFENNPDGEFPKKYLKIIKQRIKELEE